MPKKDAAAKDPLVQLNVRVPKETLEDLRDLAERDHRSATQQVIFLIEQAAHRKP